MKQYRQIDTTMRVQTSMDVMLIVFCMAATLLAAALTVPAGFGLATCHASHASMA